MRFIHWVKFWLLWIFSSGFNFLIFLTLRQFYMTDDVYSDYFVDVAGRIDNLVTFVGIFFSVVLVYLLNSFYKEKILERFIFVSSWQFLIYGILRLITIPFMLKLNPGYQLTVNYVLVSGLAICAAPMLFRISKGMSSESSKVMVKKLFKLIRPDKYW